MFFYHLLPYIEQAIAWILKLLPPGYEFHW